MNPAIASYRRALELDPELAETHHNLGHVYFSLGQYREAVQEYRQAIRLAPDWADAYSSLGRGLSAMGKTVQALPYFKKAAKLDESKTYLKRNLIRARNLEIQRKRRKRAAEDAQQ